MVPVAQQGSLDALGEDMSDVLNESLESAAFAHLFRGTRKASVLVNIESVMLNRDCSHATASWTSDIYSRFALVLHQKMGQEEAQRFAKKSVAYVTKKLQAAEPKFRSLIVNKMEFKRVPRLMFRPLDETLGLPGAGSKGEDRRQHVLREEAEWRVERAREKARIEKRGIAMRQREVEEESGSEEEEEEDDDDEEEDNNDKTSGKEEFRHRHLNGSLKKRNEQVK